MNGDGSKPGPKMQCPDCKTVIQSMHRHHMVVCNCENQAMVDGGDAYLRMGCKTHMPVRFEETK